MSRPSHLESMPPVRMPGVESVSHALLSAHRIVLTTHVNADGDGLGSEVALVHLLRALGKDPVIANPTRVPERYRFMVESIGKAERSGDTHAAIKSADLFCVLDISDL